MADHATLDAIHDALQDSDKKKMPEYAIDSTDHYWVLDNRIMHCGEQQFVHECKYCSQTMECYYCEFDYSTKHECEDMSV